MEGFSERIVLPNIPEGPGLCLIEDEAGNILQIAESINIRRLTGELMDSEGKICVHGPKIYAAQQHGERIYFRWKLTPFFKQEKKQLIELLQPRWKKLVYVSVHRSLNVGHDFLMFIFLQICI